jgi:hypothetical protein
LGSGEHTSAIPGITIVLVRLGPRRRLDGDDEDFLDTSVLDAPAGSDQRLPGESVAGRNQTGEVAGGVTEDLGTPKIWPIQTAGSWRLAEIPPQPGAPPVSDIFAF